MSRQDEMGTTQRSGEALPPIMREIPSPVRVDYANLPTAELRERFWGFMRNPLSDVAISLANAKISGQTVPNDLGELSPLVDAALGMRKAHGRNLSREDVATDLGVEVPDGFVPSFTLYLQAARIRPDDAAERRLITEIKNGVRRHIRAIRK